MDRDDADIVCRYSGDFRDCSNEVDGTKLLLFAAAEMELHDILVDAGCFVVFHDTAPADFFIECSLVSCNVLLARSFCQRNLKANVTFDCPDEFTFIMCSKRNRFSFVSGAPSSACPVHIALFFQLERHSLGQAKRYRRQFPLQPHRLPQDSGNSPF